MKINSSSILLLSLTKRTLRSNLSKIISITFLVFGCYFKGNTQIFDFTSQSHKINWYGSSLNLDNSIDHAKKELLKFNYRQSKNGGVAYIGNRKLEDGSKPKSVLLMHPRMESNGSVFGRVNIPRLAKNSKLTGSFGFARPDPYFDSSPFETDGARFLISLRYRDRISGRSGTKILLDTYKKKTGKLMPIDINLSAYENHFVIIELRVDAGKTAKHDLAIWKNLRLEQRMTTQSSKKTKIGFKVTFLGMGYKWHNREDCSRIYVSIDCYLKADYIQNGKLFNEKISPFNSSNTRLVLWNKKNNKGEWVKRHKEAVSVEFEITPYNFSQLKSEQRSFIFYVNKDAYEAHESPYYIMMPMVFKSCHKNDGIWGFNCNVIQPENVPHLGSVDLKFLFRKGLNKKPIYFNGGYAPGTQRHGWKTYFKIELI